MTEYEMFSDKNIYSHPSIQHCPKLKQQMASKSEWKVSCFTEDMM